MALTQAGLDAEINAQLPTNSNYGIPAGTLRAVLHDMNAAIFQGSSGVSGLAAPTGSVGLTAVAGVLTTAMPSDAAPALSQAIAPTWTGLHAFANTTASTTPATGAVTIAGGLGIGGALNVGSGLASGKVSVAGGSLTLNGITSGATSFNATATGSVTVTSPTGSAAAVQAAQRIAATVTAVANTDFTLNIPTGATILGVTVYTTTAFTGTTAMLQAGSAVGGATYIGPISIQALGVYALTLASTGPAQGSMPAGTPNYFIRIVQTGPTAVGAATIVVDYLLP